MYEMEPYIYNWILEYANKDGIAFDIGANNGAYSYIMSERFRHVHAFEPAPTNFRWIYQNLKRFGMPNITIVEKAISNFTGECRLYPHSQHSTEYTISKNLVDNFLKENYLTFSDEIYETVPCITIDKYVEEIGEIPAFIKCDIEGAEDFIFEGALNTLKNDIIIALEVHSAHWGIDQQKLWNFFNNLGFKILNKNKEMVDKFKYPAEAQEDTHYLLIKGEKIN